MKLSKKSYSMIPCLFVLLAVSPAFSQDESPAQAPAPEAVVETAAPVAAPAAAAAAVPAEAMAGDLSMYGEVRSVDVAASSITVQYYDYDTDEEKNADIAISAETKLDGAASLADIRQNDWVDVIYTTDGTKNSAKSVIVEKEEITEPMPDEAMGPGANTEEEY